MEASFLLTNGEKMCPASYFFQRSLLKWQSIVTLQKGFLILWHECFLWEAPILP